jgi:hypothetical protein
MGFARSEDSILRSTTCDVADSSLTGGDVGGTGAYRLCWATNQASLEQGWRSGLVDGLQGGTTTHERVIFRYSNSPEPPDEYGLLRVITEPAVGSSIYVDGVLRNSWGLNWLKLPPGTYEVAFGDVPGFGTPEPRIVEVNAGETTETTGTFQRFGALRIVTLPTRSTTIYANGIPRNRWGAWFYTAPGQYETCFGPVAGISFQGCQVATVVGDGSTTSITATSESSPGAAGESGKGWLRVATSPPVASTISIDGEIRDTWALNWVSLDPGEYVVSFSDVPDVMTPAPITVQVVERGGFSVGITELTATFTLLGTLHVITDPPVPATIFIGGVPRDDWGVFTQFLPGTYPVCFGEVPQFSTPPCRLVTVVAGSLTETTGSYEPVD